MLGGLDSSVNMSQVKVTSMFAAARSTAAIANASLSPKTVARVLTTPVKSVSIWVVTYAPKASILSAGPTGSFGSSSSGE